VNLRQSRRVTRGFGQLKKCVKEKLFSMSLYSRFDDKKRVKPEDKLNGSAVTGCCQLAKSISFLSFVCLMFCFWLFFALFFFLGSESRTL